MGWISHASPYAVTCGCDVLRRRGDGFGTVEAQTLTNPNPKPRASATSSQQSKSVKPCPAYGPGFVQVAGTDLCIKVGGSVQIDVGR